MISTHGMVPCGQRVILINILVYMHVCHFNYILITTVIHET